MKSGKENHKDSDNILGIGKTHEILQTPTATTKILKDAGFECVQVFLTKSTANSERYQEYISLIIPVLMKPYLSYLPDGDGDGGDNGVRNSFIGAFLDKPKEKGTQPRKETPTGIYYR